MPEDFLANCRLRRDEGYNFLTLELTEERVLYTLTKGSSFVQLEQGVEERKIRSIAQIFPIADFAERQLYQLNQVKSIGNPNLKSHEDDAES